MKLEKTFSEVLRDVLNKEISHKSEEYQKTEKINLELNFGFFDLNSPIFKFKENKYQKPQKPEIKTESKSEPVIEVVKEKVRVRRKLTFDQEKALKVFHKYGVTSLDDYTTDEEIKKAYRRLAKKHHPDVKGVNSDLAFKEISKAYHTLI